MFSALVVGIWTYPLEKEEAWYCEKIDGVHAPVQILSVVCQEVLLILTPSERHL